MKLKNLRLQDFRNFERFELGGLGRINLLVGTNNCGKTTVLEAVNILMAKGDSSAIWSALTRRGEEFYDERESIGAGHVRQIDIRRLFRGHEIEVGRSFELSADSDAGGMSMIARIDEYGPTQPQLFDSEDFPSPISLALQWSNGSGKNLKIPISRNGGINVEAMRRTMRIMGGNRLPIEFVTASSLAPDTVASLFEDIVLTPEEDLVTDAMRIIEPAIERIASSGADSFRSTGRRGGIFVRLTGVNDRVPIGSLGDGIWRMLGLALSAVKANNGILLVDDIDTGLHHTVMRDMWRFLFRYAEQYDIQIIATTHSWDCCHALAGICRENISEDSDVTISRIERDREQAVHYTEQEIIAASDRDIEVR